MGWWSDLKRKVKEFFMGEDAVEKPDVSPYLDKEKELNDALKKIADEFEESYKPDEGYEDIEDLLPEEIEFEYKEYEGDDEQTIKDKTTQKYEDQLSADKEELNTEYDGKVGQLENKKENATAESQIKQDELDKEYDEIKKQIEDSLVQRGMYRSSVKQGQEDFSDAQKALESDKINQDLANKLSGYDSEIEKLRNEEKTAIDGLNLKYAQQIQSEIDKLLGERQKQIDDINKYNNELKVKEAKYIEDRLLAIEKQLSERIKDNLEIKELEEKTGYVGEKDKNYKQRYELAREFYLSMPKDVAQIMYSDNSKLRDYLGLYYNKLGAEILRKQG